MIRRRGVRAAFAAAVLLVSTACQGDTGANAATEQGGAANVVVTVETRNGPKAFNVEVARTAPLVPAYDAYLRSVGGNPSP